MTKDDPADRQLRTCMANLNEIPLARLAEVAGPTLSDLHRRIVHAPDHPIRPPVSAFNSSL